MSLRDISIILREYHVSHGIPSTDNDNNKNSNYNNSPDQIATEAYKLFSEGKKPFEVAIELGIREAQVNKFFREFWKLKNLNELYEIYPQIRHYLSHKIPEIQKQYSKAKDELEVIEYKRVMSKHELDNMNNQIILLRRGMYQLSATCKNKRNEIAYLQNQIQVFAGHINALKNRNRQQQEEI
jgi:hypothetical protein